MSLSLGCYLSVSSPAISALESLCDLTCTFNYDLNKWDLIGLWHPANLWWMKWGRNTGYMVCAFIKVLHLHQTLQNSLKCMSDMNNQDDSNNTLWIMTVKHYWRWTFVRRLEKLWSRLPLLDEFSWVKSKHVNVQCVWIQWVQVWPTESCLVWTWCRFTWNAWLAKPNPSCLQTTMASIIPQFSLQTVPQTREPFFSARTSTRPSKGFLPPLRRICCSQKYPLL